MADGTHIEWTDATWNVVNGCSVLTPGCTNCYAMRLAGTRLKHHPSRAGLTIDTKAGPVWTGEVRFNDKVLLDPLRWRRPRRIFVCAHGDLFHDEVPDEWLDRVFAVMALAPHHTFQVLTKRPERMRAYLSPAPENALDAKICALDPKLWAEELSSGPRFPLPNVWLGTSVEDQKRADERIPILLDTPAAVRWLSMEPLLGTVDLTDVNGQVPEYGAAKAHGIDVLSPHNRILRPQIDWVVAGGESGPGARPMHTDWARSLRDQCARSGVPFLFKQWGAWKPLEESGDGYWPTDAEHCIRLRPDGTKGDDGYPLQRIGKHAAGRLLDGVQHDGYPA